MDAKGAFGMNERVVVVLWRGTVLGVYADWDAAERACKEHPDAQLLDCMVQK